MTPSLDLSAKLGALKERAGYASWSELARELGVDPSIVLVWSSGSRGVPAARLHALALALDVSYQELTGNAPAKVPKRQVIIPSADRPRGVHPDVRVIGQSMSAYSLGGNPHGGPSPVPGRPRRN